MITVPVCYTDKPNSNNIYLTREVYKKVLDEYFSEHDTVPVCLADSGSCSDVIGECTFYNLENNVANISFNKPDFNIDNVDDYALYYKIATDSSRNYFDENGIEILTNAKLLSFVLDVKSNSPYNEEE